MLIGPKVLRAIGTKKCVFKSSLYLEFFLSVAIFVVVVVSHHNIVLIKQRLCENQSINFHKTTLMRKSVNQFSSNNAYAIISKSIFIKQRLCENQLINFHSFKLLASL